LLLKEQNSSGIKGYYCVVIKKTIIIQSVGM